MELHHLLKELGLDEREVRVYSALLGAGSCSARQLADQSGLNRAAVMDAVKRLGRLGLVTGIVKHKKDLYSAENPDRLLQLAERREQSVAAIRRRLAEILPELSELHRLGGAKPAVRHYEGNKGAAIILDDLLRTMSGQPDKTFRVFASPHLKRLIVKCYPRFPEESVDRRLRPHVIGMGEGDDGFGAAERRQLGSGAAPVSSSVVIYGNKVAVFSLDGDSLRGLLIEDSAAADIHRVVFDRVWESLT